jgi:hypothetical protein
MHIHRERAIARNVALVRSDNQHLIRRLGREEAAAGIASGRYIALGRPHKIVSRIIVAPPPPPPPDREAVQAPVPRMAPDRIPGAKPTTIHHETSENTRHTIMHRPMTMLEYAIFRAPISGRDTRAESRGMA